MHKWPTGADRVVGPYTGFGVDTISRGGRLCPPFKIQCAIPLFRPMSTPVADLEAMIGGLYTPFLVE